MCKSKLLPSVILSITLLLLPDNSHSAAAAAGGAAALGAGDAAFRAEGGYKDIPLPEVVQADVNTRKEAIKIALSAGGFDISNNVRRNAKLAAEGRNKDHILAIHENSRSSEENREYRFSMGSGAFVASNRMLFYVKGKQPKYGATVYPFAVLSKRDIGNPYPKERAITYSAPIEGNDVLSVKDFGHNELCMKSKWVKDDKGRIVKDAAGKNMIAQVDPAASMRCVKMMNDLLTNIDGAFADLANHRRIKNIFVGYRDIENQCAGVFAIDDCNTRKAGEPTYQRIHMLKQNFRSLIWAYNYLLHEAEMRAVGPMEGDAAA